MSDWNMPEAPLGSIVNYYAHEGAEPNMGFVAKAGKNTLTLWVLSPGYGGVEKPSVHHKDDPGLNDFPDWRPYGTWDAMPRDSRVAALSERLAALERRVAEIEGKKAK